MASDHNITDSDTAALSRELRRKEEDLKSALLQIKSLQKQLVEQDKLASIGQLSAGIAHEIKNPLNFVTNFAELSTSLIDELKAELETQKGKSIDDDFLGNVREIMDDLFQNIEKINKHGKRAVSIIQNILSQSRGVANEFSDVDINALLEEYLNLAYHGMRARNQQFNVTMETEFDETIGKISVLQADISRVFLNMFNNAFDAIGGASPTVWVRTKNLGDKAEIRIRDNGEGIPPQNLKKIFVPFFTTKPNGSGNTGLGLAISYQIVVKQHKGELEVESELGKFTEFIIRLPKKGGEFEQHG